MTTIRRVCVYCGSSPGGHVDYLRSARDLGQALSARGLGLVYGGAKVGLMGELANAVLRGGGEVIGIMPSALVAREVAHDGLSELRVVDSMHERKALMADLADAFIALPGGFGTLDELAEILTWAQLGIHAKPTALLNTRGYFDRLMEFVEHAIDEGFIQSSYRSLMITARDPNEVLDLMVGYSPPHTDKAAWALSLSRLSVSSDGVPPGSATPPVWPRDRERDSGDGSADG